MRISIETSQPHIVQELFKYLTKEQDTNTTNTTNTSTSTTEEQQDTLKNLLCEKEPSFVELLNYMRMLWSSRNNLYINVLYNIVMYPQFMISRERCTPKEYAIYKSIFNSKNYMPNIVILLYDDNTTGMENMLNDPFFKIQVFKVQLIEDMLSETAQMLSDTLVYIYENCVDDISQFSYFEQCYANYNCINKKK